MSPKPDNTPPASPSIPILEEEEQLEEIDEDDILEEIDIPDEEVNPEDDEMDEELPPIDETDNIEDKAKVIFSKHGSELAKN